MSNLTRKEELVPALRGAQNKIRDARAMWSESEQQENDKQVFINTLNQVIKQLQDEKQKYPKSEHNTCYEILYINAYIGYMKALINHPKHYKDENYLQPHKQKMKNINIALKASKTTQNISMPESQMQPVLSAQRSSMVSKPLELGNEVGGELVETHPLSEQTMSDSDIKQKPKSNSDLISACILQAMDKAVSSVANANNLIEKKEAYSTAEPTQQSELLNQFILASSDLSPEILNTFYKEIHSYEEKSPFPFSGTLSRIAKSFKTGNMPLVHQIRLVEEFTKTNREEKERNSFTEVIDEYFSTTYDPDLKELFNGLINYKNYELNKRKELIQKIDSYFSSEKTSISSDYSLFMLLKSACPPHALLLSKSLQHQDLDAFKDVAFDSLDITMPQPNINLVIFDAKISEAFKDWYDEILTLTDKDKVDASSELLVNLQNITLEYYKHQSCKDALANYEHNISAVIKGFEIKVNCGVQIQISFFKTLYKIVEAMNFPKLKQYCFELSFRSKFLI